MNDWKPLDYMMGILVVTVVVILLMVMASVVFDDTVLTEKGATRVNIIINSIVAIISMYVGAQIQKERDSNKK